MDTIFIAIGVAFLFVVIIMLALYAAGLLKVSYKWTDLPGKTKPRSVYVYGPAGCGKTTNAEKIRRHFGLDLVIDEYGMMGGRLEVPAYGALVLGCDFAAAPLNVRTVVSFEAAMELAK